MTEFTKGMYEVSKSVGKSSLLLSFIFFVGHVIIATFVVKLMTGVSIWEAGAVALVEPAVNSIWFYLLHKIWNKYFVGD